MCRRVNRGWRVAECAWREGRRTGFIDVAQLSFMWSHRCRLGSPTALRYRKSSRPRAPRCSSIVAPLEIQPSDLRGVFPCASSRSCVGRRMTISTTAPSPAHVGEAPMVAGDGLLRSSAAQCESRDHPLPSSVKRFAIRPGETVVDTQPAPMLFPPLSSVSTCSQNVAPSPPSPAHRPVRCRVCRAPSRLRRHRSVCRGPARARGPSPSTRRRRSPDIPVCGSNEASVSRGTSISTGPISVSTVFDRTPLRELPWFRPTGSCLS